MSNYHYLKFIILFFGLFLFNTSYAQQNSGGVPVSFQKESVFSRMKSNINALVLPVVNNEAEQQRADSIAAITCTDCDNQYYGKGLNVAIDIKNQGQLEVLEDSSKLWVLKVESSTAFGMQFYFDKFKLPEGARLFIFNEDRTMVLGAFTASNNPNDESKLIKFGTQYIEGKNIFIEYNEPLNPEVEGEVSITKIIHVFKDIISKSGPFGSSGACNINVSCPEGFGWTEEINSVALILGYDNNNDLTAWCSGALINNTSEDGTPLFLTAKHCIDGNIGQNSLFDYSTWLFLFNHQTTTCSSDGSDVSSYTGQSVYGSLLLEEDGAGSPTSDYLLLDLNTSEQVLASYGACYAGWSLTSSPQPPFTGIHHPSGDVKKISIDQSPTESTFYNNYQPTNQGNHWKINWDNGTTEGGSSGSPLFDNNHRIVGQLHGGNAACNGINNNNGEDWYGKFTTSWQQGGFAFWLDPNNTGQTSVSTYCASSGSGGGGSGGGGSGGGGGGPLTECWYFFGEEMSVNDNNSSFPCVEGNIVLTPTVRNGCENAVNKWRGVIEIKTQSCSSAPDNSKCKRKFFTPWRCDCAYINYFLEITEVNASLNPIGPAHSKWFSVQYDKHYVEFPDEKYVPYQESIVVDAWKLVQLGMTLELGKYYRIKLAHSNFTWNEDVKYFKYIPVNISKSGVIQGNLSASNNITISNATINQPIEVVAGNSITFLPGTTLNAGHYYIDEDLCDNDKSGMKMRNKSGDDTNSNNSNDNTTELTSSDKKKSENTNHSISIYPNPTNGQFNIKNDANLTELVELELVDLLGNTILKNVDTKNTYTFNLSGYPKGIYLLKTKVGSKLRGLLKINSLLIS